MPITEPLWSTREVAEACAETRKAMLEQIVGNIDTELLRTQRNHLIKLAEGTEIKANEFYLDGIINLLDNMLDVLDLYTGA